MAAATAWRRFGHWRRRRPFWGGLLLVLAGLTLFFSANLTLADMKVHFGQEGYLSYLLPLILLLCGALIMATPAQRVFYAVVGLATALYSLIGLNLGGFGVGMLLGIVGGALALAWTPARRPGVEPAAAAQPPAARPAVEPEAPPFGPPGDDGSPTDILPGFDQHHGTHRKLFVLVLVPLVVTAGWLIAGGGTPAHAEECPKGLPSRSVASSPEPSRSARPARPATRTPAPETTPAPAPTPSAGVVGGTGDPLVDGWNDFVDGLGEFLGAGPEETPSPSAPPSAGPPAAPPASVPPSASPAWSASAKPRPSTSPGLPEVPCLGPRVVKKAAAGDVPVVSRRGGLLEGRSLTMYDSSYDGVVELPSADGTVKALKFSMRKAVTKPFSLTIPESGGRTTSIRSKALTIEGDVRFYTPRFAGKLFGLIPVTFTPDRPPPLTLPVLWFTDVRIDLAFVECDRLTADPLDIRELA